MSVNMILINMTMNIFGMVRVVIARLLKVVLLLQYWRWCLRPNQGWPVRAWSPWENTEVDSSLLRSSLQYGFSQCVLHLSVSPHSVQYFSRSFHVWSIQWVERSRVQSCDSNHKVSQFTGRTVGPCTCEGSESIKEYSKCSWRCKCSSLDILRQVPCLFCTRN